MVLSRGTLLYRLCCNLKRVFAFNRQFNALTSPASALHSKESSYLRWVSVMVVGQDFYSSSVCKNVCSPHGLLTTQNAALWITGNLSDSPQICSTLPELLCSPRIALEIKITYSWISTLLYLSLRSPSFRYCFARLYLFLCLKAVAI